MKTNDAKVDFTQFTELAQSHTPVTATVTGVNKNREKHIAGVNVIVLGLRAFLPASELSKGESPEKLTGDIQVVVIKADAEKQRVVVSRKAHAAIASKDAVTKLGNGQVVTAVVKKVGDAGAVASIEVDGNSVRAFIPRSHIRGRNVQPQTVLKKGDRVNATILEINAKQGEVVLSLKRAATQEFLSSAQVDSTIEGTIVNQVEIGFFVNVGPMDGLLHVSQIPAGRELAVGDKVEVRIRHINLEKEQLGLTLLAAQPQTHRRETPSISRRRTERVPNIASYSTKATTHVKSAPKKRDNGKVGVFDNFADLAAYFHAKDNGTEGQAEATATEATTGETAVEATEAAPQS